MPGSTTDYRLAPGLAARIAGAGLLVLGVVLCAGTVLVAVLSWPIWIIGALAAIGLLAVGVLAVAARRAYVVRLGADGYRIRLIRGAGALDAAWSEVAEAGTASRQGVACVVITLRDHRTSTIPVSVLGVDRDVFVAEVRARLVGRGNSAPEGTDR